jgi:hypothetical protein
MSPASAIKRQRLLRLLRVKPGQRVAHMDDDVVAHLHVFDQGQGDVLAHAAQVDDGLIIFGDFHNTGGDGETHGGFPFLAGQGTFGVPRARRVSSD